MLAGLGSLWAHPEAGGSALAQGARDDDTAPPADAPIMRPGQRVQRDHGWVGITTFNRSYAPRQQESVFTLQFTFLNEHSRETTLRGRDIARLVTDGVPRAPVQWFPDRANIPPESAQECSLTFRVRGRPGVVLVQFGTGDEIARSFLRWPD